MMPSSRWGKKDHTQSQTQAPRTAVMKLMSVVTQTGQTHLGANTKFFISDLVQPAEQFFTSSRSEAVKLRMAEKGLGAEQPTSIPTLLQNTCSAHPDTVAVRYQSCGGQEWSTITYHQLMEQVKVVGRALIELGLSRHHSLGVITGSSSSQALICHLAAVFAGGLATCLSSGLSLEDTARACVESKVDVIVVQHQASLRNILAIQHRLPQLKVIILLHGEASVTDKRRLARSGQKEILSWSGLLELGQKLSEGKLSERVKRISVNQAAVICYDCQGRGCLYSHDNIVWTSKMIAQGLVRPAGFQKPASPGEEIVINLCPLSDISSQIVEVFYPLSVAGTIVIPTCDTVFNHSKVFQVIREVQPTLIWGSVRFYEKIYQKLRGLLLSMSRVKKIILEWYSTQSKLGSVPHRLVMASLMSECRDYLGLPGKTVLLCREGERLQPSVHHYLSTCGLTVHTTFGLQQTSGLLTANIPKRFCKLGTAGKQLPGLSLRLTQRKEAGTEGEGVGEKEEEMAVYGRNIFMGFLNREEDLKVLSDGWLELSQMASVDEEGYLRIFSRPEEELQARVESRVRLELECVAHCLLLDLEGEEEERTGLVVSLDCQYDDDGAPTELLSQDCQRWFAEAGWETVRTVGDVMSNLKEEQGIRHCIQAGVDRANQLAASPGEWIDQWELKTTCLAFHNGELLPSQGQVNKTQVINRYQTQISQIFNKSVDPLVGGGGPKSLLSSEMLFAFPHHHHHHLSQIIEEEERQSSRNSEDLTPEVRKKKEGESEGERGDQQITPSNSDGSTKDSNIGEKEKESQEKPDDGNNNTEEDAGENLDIQEANEEESEESVKNKRKISRM